MEYIKINIKSLLLGLLCLSLFSCNSQSTVNSEEEFLLLSPTEFDKRVEAEENLQLIDVRTPSEFVGGTMWGAVNYNLLDGTFEREISHLDTNKTVFVYCEKGGRSSKAAEILKEKGFNSIVDLKGGFDAWDKQR